MAHRKPIFFTSDWHIGHENSLKFDSRPFTDLEHMHRVLVNNFNSTVPPDGITYCLGDMGLCASGVLKAIIEQLNGTLVLVLGNHDGGHQAMYNAGFDVVLNAAQLQIAGEVVTMSHCPLPGLPREDTTGMLGSNPGDNWHGENKPSAKWYTVPSVGQFHVHGHIHSPNKGKSIKILGKQMDIGVVANNYRPVSVSAIESWISKHKQGILK